MHRIKAEFFERKLKKQQRQKTNKMCNKSILKVFLLLTVVAIQVHSKHQQQFRRNRNSGKLIIIKEFNYSKFVHEKKEKMKFVFHPQ